MFLLLTVVTPAFADTLSDKRAQAAAVEAQLAELDAKASMADEAYNVARDRDEQLTAQVNEAQRRIDALQKRTDALQADLAVRADQIYRGGGTLDQLAALLSARTFAEFDATLNALQAIGRQDAETAAALKKTQADAEVAHQTLAVAQAESAQQRSVMEANAKDVHDKLAAKTAVLNGLSKDIKKLIAQAKAKKAAEDRARYLALLARQRAEASNGSGGSGGSGNDSGGDPPASSKGAAAVWWAEKALGRPYRWAASGPNSFDCSGLTMWAYGHVGVSLPHSSRAQIGYGSRVSRDNLRPGDLVFFGSPIHHVGMYVGGGDFIEAPYTGANVRISSLSNRSDYAGASRP